MEKNTVVTIYNVTFMFFFSLRAILQQNARFNEVEEKYKYLYEKAADLLALEKKLSAASRKVGICF